MPNLYLFTTFQLNSILRLETTGVTKSWTGTWGLGHGTWDLEREDVGFRDMGLRDVGLGDTRTSGHAGTRGHRDTR